MPAATQNEQPRSSAFARGSPSNRTKALSDVITDEAVERTIGRRVAPEIQRAVRAELAPWVERFVRLTDDLIRIPGTNIHIGIDPIVGLLLPGAGDVLTGASSVVLLLVALRERVPTVAIGRMVINIAIDALVGAIPIVGDAFDVVWRANRRNLEILERHRGDPSAEPTTLDKVLVYGGVVLAVLSVALPLAIALLFGFSLGAALGAR